MRRSFADSWIATHDLEGKVFEFLQFPQFLTKLASSGYLWLILALPKSLDEDVFFPEIALATVVLTSSIGARVRRY